MSKQYKNRQRQFTTALKGQKIIKVKTTINCMTLHLSNGKTFDFETEYVGRGTYGIIKKRNKK